MRGKERKREMCNINANNCIKSSYLHYISFSLLFLSFSFSFSYAHMHIILPYAILPKSKYIVVNIFVLISPHLSCYQNFSSGHEVLNFFFTMHLKIMTLFQTVINLENRQNASCITFSKIKL